MQNWIVALRVFIAIYAAGYVFVIRSSPTVGTAGYIATHTPFSPTLLADALVLVIAASIFLDFTNPYRQLLFSVILIVVPIWYPVMTVALVASSETSAWGAAWGHVIAWAFVNLAAWLLVVLKAVLRDRAVD